MALRCHVGHTMIFHHPLPSAVLLRNSLAILYLSSPFNCILITKEWSHETWTLHHSFGFICQFASSKLFCQRSCFPAVDEYSQTCTVNASSKESIMNTKAILKFIFRETTMSCAERRKFVASLLALRLSAKVSFSFGVAFHALSWTSSC